MSPTEYSDKDACFRAKVVETLSNTGTKKRAAEEASDTYIGHSMTYQTVFILYSGMNTETYLP